MGVLFGVGGWLDGWVNGWGCGWLCGSICQWVGLGQSTKNLIDLDLIEIIQFCLKIYDLWVDGWFSGSKGGVKSNH